jgi:hypothetical protein
MHIGFAARSRWWRLIPRHPVRLTAIKIAKQLAEGGVEVTPTSECQKEIILQDGSFFF